MAGLLLCLFSVPAMAEQVPQLVVTYGEWPAGAGAAARTGAAAYAARVRETGAAETEVLVELGRPNRVAVIERWPGAITPAAADGATFEQIAGTVVEAPLDRRTHDVLTPPLHSTRIETFHMLMHVDVVPAGAEQISRLLVAHREQVLASAGALGFELAVQSGKPNHFAVHETWASRAAYEAYAASPAARALRGALAGFKGALFDDRLFLEVPVAGPAR